ncbi:MAG: hypothetical protein M3384_21150 [Acidobacteriota bacterium]|nr:hypothetical protein [Acidobacteriota bacterium]
MKTLLMRILTALALTTVIFAALAQAQPEAAGGDRVVAVTGEYRLKQSDIDRLTEVYEWMLAGKFTAEQRGRYQTLIIAEAQTSLKAAENIVTITRSYDKIQAADPAKREEFRRQILPEIVSGIEKENTEISRLLLDVYRSGRGAGANSTGDDTTNEPQPEVKSTNGGAVKPADLAGTWSTSSAQGERYKSLKTGDLSDAGGTIIEYAISPNGQIEYTGYMSNTIYACTTKLFVTKKGRISISGSNITFDYTSGERDFNSSCNSSLNGVKPIPPAKKTTPFTLERTENGVKLCTLEDGNQFCIYKKS